MEKRKRVVSLFSGAGGLDSAFEASGYFSTALYVESEPLFAETLRLNQARGNLASAPILQRDIRSLDPIETCRFLSDEPGLWGLIGGPPCESFSCIGKQRGRHDERGALLFTFADWVSRLPIRFFLMENVPGLLAIESGRVFEDLLGRFAASGFQVSHAILCAADYGSPTMRRRLFVVGVRDLGRFEFPKPTHGFPCDSEPSLLPWATSRAALAGLPEPAPRHPGTPQGHVLIKHTPPVRTRFQALAPGSVDRIRKRNRLDSDRPAPGLYAGNLNGIRFHIHPTEPREITNREAARIQGFQDTFVFNGGRVAVGKQIANAVPIALARALADALGKHCLIHDASDRSTPLRASGSGIAG